MSAGSIQRPLEVDLFAIADACKSRVDHPAGPAKLVTYLVVCLHKDTGRSGDVRKKDARRKNPKSLPAVSEKACVFTHEGSRHNR